jgi:acetoin utilization deacetylase AcuC-like enzyme
LLKVAWSPVYRYNLPPEHRFPMDKYALLPEQLLYEGTLTDENFFHPGALDRETALLVHTPEYWDKLSLLTLTPREERAIGFPVNASFIQRARHITQGTIECARFALQYGCALNTAGGTHHAFADRGEGYCCLNDQAVAARYMLEKGYVHSILVIDLDVHQGNGTAHIMQDDPRVFTFSMHGARNYPTRKETSNLDIPLPDGTDDAAYLHILENTLEQLIDQVQPELVFYQSGVDVLQTDRLGRLALTRRGCRNRDYTVLHACYRHRVPVAVSMGGGYSERLADIVEAHANTFRVAQEIFF